MEQPEIVENAGLWDGRLLTFESLPSTNQWALDNIGSCLHGDVIWAARQTAGRGRFLRKWLSPANRCLTVSVVIQPESPDDFMVKTIAQTGALAVRSTLEKYSIKAMVKWPNDVLVNGRKIAGILAESESQAGALILGIGLNVNLVPGDLSCAPLMQPATSMAIEKKRTFDMGDMCARLLSELETMIGLVARERESFLINTWQKHDFLMEKRVEVRTHEGTVSGKYAGLDKNGRLRLIDDAGQERLFWTGDVSIIKEF